MEKVRYWLKKYGLPGLLLLLIIILWGVGADLSKAFEQRFSSPMEVWLTAKQLFVTESFLVNDVWYSFRNILAGYILGNVVALIIVVLLWSFPKLALTVEPYIIFLSSIPIFALAPITVFWFGIDDSAKIILVILHVVFLAISYGYQGTKSIHGEYEGLFRAWKASRLGAIRYLILPGISLWIDAALKSTAAMAVLGEFIAEFISSQRGLCHFILMRTGTYDYPQVFVGVVLLGSFALVLSKSFLILKLIGGGRALSRRIK